MLTEILLKDLFVFDDTSICKGEIIQDDQFTTVSARRF